jgi:Ni/Co efflux regulator RcnB
MIGKSLFSSTGIENKTYMKKLFYLLTVVFALSTTAATAQVDSAAMVKRQKEIEKSEKTINQLEAKVSKQDRKTKRALKKAERKERKKDKRMKRLRKAERKHDELINTPPPAQAVPVN